MSLKSFITLTLTVGLTAVTMAAENMFRLSATVASSTSGNYASSMAVDGVVSRASAWITSPDSRAPHILEVTLPYYCDIDSVAIESGIPAHLMTQAEKGRNAGFWCVKNFIVQYWDDANWTDIAETLTTENRQDRAVFHFAKRITSYRFRLVSSDGEPIRITEFQGYGVANKALPSPQVILAMGASDVSPCADLMVRVKPQVTGRTMKYVAYNQGYIIPGSNAGAWLEYSGVNSVRVWTQPDLYINKSSIVDTRSANSLAQFDALKAEFRADPAGDKFIRWDSVAKKMLTMIPSTNSMQPKFAFDLLKGLGMEVVLQASPSNRCADWGQKWRQWHAFYAFAFYLAREADVSMMALQNEPNHRHAGPVPLDSWIEMMRICSDAFNCAIIDVNRMYGKKLDARFVGPVTAGTNTNWWATIAAAVRTDYRGQSTEKDLVSLFSTHSYNQPGAGYATKTQMINQLLAENHPSGGTIPVVYTEIGRWMNAYLIDKAETMDSPSLFTEWAGIYTNNTLGGAHGMWAFKFANTASSTYPRGIKSGHHHTSKGRRLVEDAYGNLAKGASVRASHNGDMAALVVDGNKADSSAWVAVDDAGKWIEIEMAKIESLDGMVIYTGSQGGEFTAPDRVRNLKVFAKTPSGWQAIKGAAEKEGRYAQVFYDFPQDVTTNAIRIEVADKGTTIVREVKLFGANTISQAKESFNVTGAHRTAEVVRLFAKGFKQGRPLLAIERSLIDRDLDVMVSADSAAQMVYMWVVNRNKRSVNGLFDLRPLGITGHVSAVVESVSHDKYGQAMLRNSLDDGLVRLAIKPQSVNLITIPFKTKAQRSIACDRSAVVRGGSASSKSFAAAPLSVSLDSSDESLSNVTLLNFSLQSVDIQKSGRILLAVAGSSSDQSPMRIHLYGVPSFAWSPASVNYNAVKVLSRDDTHINWNQKGIFVAGQAAFGATKEYVYLDVTDAVKRHAAAGVTFLLMREAREPGDDYDKGRSVNIESAGALAPKLILL